MFFFSCISFLEKKVVSIIVEAARSLAAETNTSVEYGPASLHTHLIIPRYVINRTRVSKMKLGSGVTLVRVENIIFICVDVEMGYRGLLLLH